MVIPENILSTLKVRVLVTVRMRAAHTPIFKLLEGRDNFEVFRPAEATRCTEG